ncbi:MAG: tetratricopeptide repeat protein [Tepidisphaeraceae bacterium]|jgi:predicted O-linked N-acetylglucosamine transferase (SPINDLY family)
MNLSAPPGHFDSPTVQSNAVHGEPLSMADSIEQVFDEALVHHRAGRLNEARNLYLQILQQRADHPETVHLLGIIQLQSGQTAQALDLVQRAVALKPQMARYHMSLGQVFLALGRNEESLAANERAVQLQPDLPEAWFARGTSLQALTRQQEALEAYNRAIQLRPDYVDALNNLGNALHLLTRTTEAIEIYRRAIDINPNQSATHNNLGIALQRQSDLVGAIASFRRSIELQDDFAGAYNNLGCALTDARQLDEAAAVLRRAIELRPGFAEAWYNLANALKRRGEYKEAIEAFQKAIELRPDYSEAHVNLGNALQAVREYSQAADSYRRAIAIRPNDVEAFNNLGSVLRSMGQVDAALATLKAALFMRPEYHIAHGNLGHVLKDAGRLDEAIASFRRAVELNPADVVSHDNLAYSVYFSSEYDPTAILRENLRWNAMHAAKLGQNVAPHTNDPNPQRRLRIGYCGADFRIHCQSFFTLPLLENHEHRNFEIFCYANVSKSDEVTERTKQLVDTWRPVIGISDEEMSRQIRADSIDILVDLTMHMSGGRLLVFARKPAPVQVTWLAYPGTTGLTAIDYRLTDPFLDPPGDSDLNYVEKSIRLPDTFWCYSALTDVPVPNPLPALSAGHITFGCLNNYCKVTRPTLALWARVLLAIPTSRLILLSPLGAHRQVLLENLRDAGVAPERIEFMEYQPRLEYLEMYHRIDIGLDTMPYNGHTTTLDSLWMGVPVLTRVGRWAVGRAGWSQLSNLAMPELAAWTDDDYVKLAIEWTRDLPRLAWLRSTLRDRMEHSPLMDGKRFARNIEAAYRTMWRKWCDESKPST